MPSVTTLRWPRAHSLPHALLPPNGGSLTSAAIPTSRVALSIPLVSGWLATSETTYVMSCPSPRAQRR